MDAGADHGSHEGSHQGSDDGPHQDSHQGPHRGAPNVMAAAPAACLCSHCSPRHLFLLTAAPFNACLPDIRTSTNVEMSITEFDFLLDTGADQGSDEGANQGAHEGTDSQAHSASNKKAHEKAAADEEADEETAADEEAAGYLLLLPGPAPPVQPPQESL